MFSGGVVLFYTKTNFLANCGAKAFGIYFAEKASFSLKRTQGLPKERKVIFLCSLDNLCVLLRQKTTDFTDLRFLWQMLSPRAN